MPRRTINTDFGSRWGGTYDGFAWGPTDETTFLVVWEDGEADVLTKVELSKICVKRRRIDICNSNLAFNPMDLKVPSERVRAAAAHYGIETNDRPDFHLRHALATQHASPPDHSDSEPWVRAYYHMLCSDDHPTTITFETKTDSISMLPLQATVKVEFGVAGRERTVPGAPMRHVNTGALGV